MPIEVEYFSQQEVLRKATTVRELVAVIENNKAAPEPVIRALLTLAVMEANDLLQISKDCGARISFKDDVVGIDDGDATDLVNKCRNAACHSMSKLRDLENNTILSMIWGQFPNALNIKGRIVGCEYTDDIAAVWGGLRLLLKRNLLRAVVEVETTFAQARVTYPRPPGTHA